MKKILLYIDSMGRGGAQRVMNNIATYFVNSNSPVCLVTDILMENEYDISTNVVRYVLSKSNQHQTNIRRINALRKIIKKEKPDTVLSFLGPCNFRMLLATLGMRCKKVVSVRNDPYREYGDHIKRVFANMMFCLASGVVFQTKDAQSYFWKSVRKKSRIILNPVADKFYENSWNAATNDIVVVGRLSAQKNPLLAVEAFSKIHEAFQQTKLVYYGNGELAKEILQFAANHQLENAVQIFDNVVDIEKRLAKARLFVMASDYEGLPNALMEAMAVGVPAVSTDCPCGGPRALIGNNENGVLVPCNDVNELSAAITELLSDEGKCKLVSKSERTKANEFKMDVIMNSWRDYLLN